MCWLQAVYTEYLVSCDNSFAAVQNLVQKKDEFLMLLTVSRIFLALVMDLESRRNTDQGHLQFLNIAFK